jgi:hypothetical protein
VRVIRTAQAMRKPTGDLGNTDLLAEGRSDGVEQVIFWQVDSRYLERPKYAKNTMGSGPVWIQTPTPSGPGARSTK